MGGHKFLLLVCVDQRFYQCLYDGIEVLFITFADATVIDSVASRIDKWIKITQDNPFADESDERNPRRWYMTGIYTESDLSFSLILDIKNV